MKRRAFLLQSGAGLAAAVLPGLAQTPGAPKEGVAVHRPEAAAEASLAEGNGGAGVAEQTWMEPNQEAVSRNNTLRNNVNPG